VVCAANGGDIVGGDAVMVAISPEQHTVAGYETIKEETRTTLRRASRRDANQARLLPGGRREERVDKSWAANRGSKVPVVAVYWTR
jgi:hypothetical protein